MDGQRADRKRMCRPRRTGTTTYATWAIENQARKLDLQYLLGHSTSAVVRRYTATYNPAKAVVAHESFSPVARPFSE